MVQRIVQSVLFQASVPVRRWLRDLQNVWAHEQKEFDRCGELCEQNNCGYV